MRSAHALKVSAPTLVEIDQRIADLEILLGKTATKADIRASEKRIIERIDELGKALGCEGSPSPNV